MFRFELGSVQAEGCRLTMAGADQAVARQNRSRFCYCGLRLNDVSSVRPPGSSDFDYIFLSICGDCSCANGSLIGCIRSQMVG